MAALRSKRLAGHAGAAVGQANHGDSAVGHGFQAGAVSDGVEHQRRAASGGVVEDRGVGLVVGLAEDQGVAVGGPGGVRAGPAPPR